MITVTQGVLRVVLLREEELMVMMASLADAQEVSSSVRIAGRREVLVLPWPPAENRMATVPGRK